MIVDHVSIQENIFKVRSRIACAAKRCGREPSSIKLLAVSKGKPPSAIEEAYAAGQRLFGENYVQELLKKMEALGNLDIEWHMIGRLQRNKVKYIVPFIKYIHSIDSIPLMMEIEKRAKRPIDCLVEVNLSGEPTKGGIEKEKVSGLIREANDMKNVHLRGLMTIPPFASDISVSRRYFKELHLLLHEVNRSGLYHTQLTELSMGMSFDMEVAIEEGATIVRVGTDIFGPRDGRRESVR